jgi:hypothetical protein
VAGSRFFVRVVFVFLLAIQALQKVAFIASYRGSNKRKLPFDENPFKLRPECTSAFIEGYLK